MRKVRRPIPIRRDWQNVGEILGATLSGIAGNWVALQAPDFETIPTDDDLNEWEKMSPGLKAEINQMALAQSKRRLFSEKVKWVFRPFVLLSNKIREVIRK